MPSMRFTSSSVSGLRPRQRPGHDTARWAYAQGVQSPNNAWSHSPAASWPRAPLDPVLFQNSAERESVSLQRFRVALATSISVDVACFGPHPVSKARAQMVAPVRKL